MRKLTLKKKPLKNIPEDNKEEKPILSKFKSRTQQNAKNKMEEENFKLEDINKYKLDEEAMKSDRLYREASQIYARKYKIKYELELEVAIVKDEIAEAIRKNPITWGLKKDERITDALINRVVVRDSEYREIYEKYIEARSQEKEWEGIKTSLEQRGWQIKLLFEMWEKNY